MSDAVIDEDFFADHLYTPNVLDPRPPHPHRAVSLRVSAFLLRRIAYAEIHVTKVLWPDFRRRHLFEAIIDFQSRDRTIRRRRVESDAAMFVEADEKPALVSEVPQRLPQARFARELNRRGPRAAHHI